MVQIDAYNLLKNFKRDNLSYSDIEKILDDNNIPVIYYVSNINDKKISVKSTEDKDEDVFNIGELKTIVRNYPYFRIEGLKISDDFKILDVEISEKSKEGYKLQRSHATMLSLKNKGLKINTNKETGIFEYAYIDCETIKNYLLSLDKDDIPKEFVNDKGDFIKIFSLKLSLLSATLPKNSIKIKQSVSYQYYTINKNDYIEFIIDDKLQYLEPDFITLVNTVDVKIRFVIESFNEQVISSIYKLKKKDRIKSLDGRFANIKIDIKFVNDTVLDNVLDSAYNNLSLRKSLVAYAKNKLDDNKYKDSCYEFYEILFRYGEEHCNRKFDIDKLSNLGEPINRFIYYLIYNYSIRNKINPFKEGEYYCTYIKNNLGLSSQDTFYFQLKWDNSDKLDKFKDCDELKTFEENYDVLIQFSDLLDDYFKMSYYEFNDDVLSVYLNRGREGINYLSEVINMYMKTLYDICNYVIKYNTDEDFKMDCDKYEDIFVPKFLSFIEDNLSDIVDISTVKELAKVFSRGFDFDFYKNDMTKSDGTLITYFEDISLGSIPFINFLNICTSNEILELEKHIVYNGYNYSVKGQPLDCQLGNLLYNTYHREEFYGYYLFCKYTPRYEVSILENDEFYIELMNKVYPYDDSLDFVFTEDDIDYSDVDYSIIEQLAHVDDFTNFITKSINIKEICQEENKAIIFSAIWRILYNEILKYDGKEAIESMNKGVMPQTLFDFCKRFLLLRYNKRIKKTFREYCANYKQVPFNKLLIFGMNEFSIETLLRDYIATKPNRLKMFKKELLDIYYNSTPELEADPYTELYDYI